MLARYRVVTNTVRGLAYVAALYIGATEVWRAGPRVSATSSFRSDCSKDRSSLFPTSASHENITDQWGSMQDVVVAISRVLEMIGQIPSKASAAAHAIPPKSAKVLSFDNVTFGYDPRTPVLTERESRSSCR